MNNTDRAEPVPGMGDGGLASARAAPAWVTTAPGLGWPGVTSGSGGGKVGHCTATGCGWAELGPRREYQDPRPEPRWAGSVRVCSVWGA